MTSTITTSSSNPVIKGGYYPSWVSNFPPSNINTDYFTHIYYSFLNPDDATFQYTNISESMARTLRDFTSTLHSKKASIKTLYSIGGGRFGISFFTRMVSNAPNRRAFILSSIEVARKFDFDGIDLDWESPENAAQMESFSSLLYEWRDEVAKDANRTGRTPLLLTAATRFSVMFYNADPQYQYPVKAINDNLDFINAMCYDYYGNWDKSSTGAHARLYNVNFPRGSTNFGLTSWINAGLIRHKLVMGLPLYGCTWKLKDPNINGIGAPSVDIGPGDDEGKMAYSEVEDFNEQNGAIVVYDEASVSVYSVAGTSWIGYDDVRSVTVKVKYAQNVGIGGYFFWDLNGDVNWRISREDAGILEKGRRAH